MNRRSFITLLGGAAATWPMAARGEQASPRLIFVMMSDGPDDLQMQVRIRAFRRGLETAGWQEGQNLHIEYRWYASNAARANAYVGELAALAPDLILVGTRAAANAVIKVNRRIPVLFVNLADPIGSGLVPSLARPGGVVTGFSAFDSEITGKWLILLREMAPQVSRVLFLYGPNTGPYMPNFVRALKEAGTSINVQTTAVETVGARAIEEAIGAFAAAPTGGLLAAPDASMTTNHELLVELAARHRLPAVYPFRFVAAAGGLAAYGIDLTDQYRQAAGYADRILKGTKPADLPVQAPTKFEFIINLKTAKSLGLDISPMLLARADEVIE